jgi:hypothetical protein
MKEMNPLPTNAILLAVHRMGSECGTNAAKGKGCRQVARQGFVPLMGQNAEYDPLRIHGIISFPHPL